MESYFEKRVNKLYQQVNKLIDSFKSDKPKAIIDTSESFFINLLVKVY